MKRIGRPKKDPEERKSKTISVRMHPSQKKILRQEANRCKTSMAEIMRQHTAEEIEPHGKGTPTPVLYRMVVKISGDLYKRAEEIETEFLNLDLRDLESDLNMKLVTLREKKERREKLWAQAERDTETTVATFKVSPKWLRRVEPSATDMGLSTLIREKMFESLRKREMMKRAKNLLGRWAQRAQTLSEWDVGRREEKIREEMQRLANEMYNTVEEEIFGDRSEV